MAQTFVAFRPSRPTEPVKPVLIVGGGLSGLAAGVELASHGIPLIILEQKSYAGGRAYSFSDPVTGDVIDNGQHVLIAGYDRTMHFLETIGTRGLLRIQPQPALVFHHPERGFRSFRLPKLPSPLHLLIGSLTTDLFSVADRLRLLRAGLDVRRCTGARENLVADLTVEQWLNSVGQSEETKRSFWEPLAVSIMNEHITAASALVFIRSLRKAFFGGWMGAAMAVPSVGLSKLYVEAALDYIRGKGGEVRCSADVVEIIIENGSVTGLRFRDGSVQEGSACLLAVPSNKLRGLLPDSLTGIDTLSTIMDIPVSPIVSIHLWFGSEFMDHDVVGLIGKRIQWVFNKRKLNVEPNSGPHVSAVISAARDFVSYDNEALTAVALEDLRLVYGLQVSDPLHVMVIREKRATFSATPAAERARPGTRTSIPNLFLCGDWTDTGYPATIEGAVLSGERGAAAARASSVAFHKSNDHIIGNKERPL